MAAFSVRPKPKAGKTKKPVTKAPTMAPMVFQA